MMYEKKTTLRPYRLISFSVGAVLIHQFCTGFGTEASAPVVACGSTVPVLVPWFWFLLLDTRVSVKE